LLCQTDWTLWSMLSLFPFFPIYTLENVLPCDPLSPFWLPILAEQSLGCSVFSRLLLVPKLWFILFSPALKLPSDVSICVWMSKMSFMCANLLQTCLLLSLLPLVPNWHWVLLFTFFACSLYFSWFSAMPVWRYYLLNSVLNSCHWLQMFSWFLSFLPSLAVPVLISELIPSGLSYVIVEAVFIQSVPSTFWLSQPFNIAYGSR